MSHPVQIESFGYLHGPPPDADITIDVRRLLHNPHTDPAMRELTGTDHAVRVHVLGTVGTSAIVASTVGMVLALIGLIPVVRVAFGCAGGRHRSVVLADSLAFRFDVIATHRDIHRPVVQRT